VNLEEYRAQREARLEKKREAERQKAENRRARKGRMRLSLLLTLAAGILVGALAMFAFILVMARINGKNKDEKTIVVNQEKESMTSEEDLEGLRVSSHAQMDGLDEAMADGTAEESVADSTSETAANVVKTPSDITSMELLKNLLVGGSTMVEALRSVYSDELVIYTGGRFYFFPIDDSLEKNNYDSERLTVNEDGTLDYELEDGTMAKKGVDVSKYQGEVDWQKVRDAGVDFAIIRAGIRGYESGKLVAEENFVENAMAASATGMEIGVYFFSQAITEEEAVEEADLVIEALDGNEISFPIVYDLERVGGGRMDGLTAEQMTDNCLAFCNRVREAGYTPMVYGNLMTFMMMLDQQRLADIDKWFAYYNNDFYYPYKYRIWQYSESGRVDGIEGDVDLNLAFY